MLNEKLYKRLVHWSKGNVIVINEDVPFVPDYEAWIATRRCGKNRKKEGTRMKRRESGEEYRVCCKECGETRHRLYINHLWGVFNETSCTRNLWLAHCWNCECYSAFRLQEKLYEQVYNSMLLYQSDLVVPTRRLKKLEGVTMPGPMQKFSDLVRRNPHHPSLEYLRSRLLDPSYLESKYDVGYCLESPEGWARDRIIAPIYYEGKLCSWQARSIGDPEGNAPKWYTCPNTKKSRMLYNFDTAQHCRTVVVVEGPGDVWNFGPQATAIFGKVISKDQIHLLSKRIRDDATVVLMLDPQKDSVSIKKNRKHHMERSLELMSRHRRFKDKVLVVYLPEEYDPGDLDREYMRDVIRWHAEKQKLVVRFSKPSL